MEWSEIEKILYTKHEWPQWVQQIFPAVFLFYKKTKPKERKQKAGFIPVSIKKEPGQLIPYKLKELKKPFKNKKTREQNIFSYASVVLLSPDDYGTIRRSFKHKGLSKLIAVFYATQEEIDSAKNCWRYHFLKFKTIKDFYNSRTIDDPRFKTICDELALRYPSSASQMKLFDD